MFRRWLTASAGIFCLALFSTGSASANEILTAVVKANCMDYKVAVTGDHLSVHGGYVVKWWFGLKDRQGNITTYNGKIPVHSMDSNGDFKRSKTYKWNPPIGRGRYSFSWGHAILFETKPHHKKWNLVYIDFHPKRF